MSYDSIAEILSSIQIDSNYPTHRDATHVGSPSPAIWRFGSLLASVLFLLLLGWSASIRAQNYNPKGFDAVKTMYEIQHPQDDLVIVSSHRGNHSLVGGLYSGKPENSFVAIGQAAQDGAEEIELDVKLTSDGIPILSHDLSWGREWCGVAPPPYQTVFSPFLDPGNYGNNLSNPAVSATSVANTRSLLGSTVLRDSISLVTDTDTHGCNLGNVLFGAYPPTLQDALNYMTEHKIAMVLSLDIRDATMAKAAWNVINSSLDGYGRNYARTTLFKVPAKAFASAQDVVNTFPGNGYSANFQPVYNTGDIAPGPMPQNQLDFGGTDVNSAATGYGSEDAIIRSLDEFEANLGINVAGVEIQIKQINGILTQVLNQAKMNYRTHLREAVTVFSPYVDYYAPGDTGRTDPLFFKTNAFCCVRLSDFYYNGAPNGQPSDTDDRRGDLNYLLQQGFNSITYDNPADYTTRLAAMGKRNLSRIQGTAAAQYPNNLLRVLPLGDSITQGYQSSTGNGYRQPLQALLNGAAEKVQFVGTQTSGTMTNPQNEGHSGWRIDEIASVTTNVLNEYHPNVVTLLIGTNDIGQNYNTSEAPTRMHNLIDQIFGAAPSIAIVVAAIPPSSDQTLQKGFVTYNAAVSLDVLARQRSGQHIVFVTTDDIDPTADKADSLHPNDSGYKKLGADFNLGVQLAIDYSWVTVPVPCAICISGGGPGIPRRPVGSLPGTGTMTKLGLIASGIGADPKTSFVHFADINGDGKADYLSVNAVGATTVYFSGGVKPDGTWNLFPLNSLLASGIGDPGSTVRFADINGDGRADYLTVSATGVVRAYFNGGLKPDGTYNLFPAPYPNQVIAGGFGPPGSNIRFGDINGDGFADYLAVDANGAVTGYLNGGPKADGSGWNWYPISGQIASGVGAPKGSKYMFADINNDGWDDYIVIDAINGTVHAWLNGGRRTDGTWIWVPQGQIAPGNGAPSKLNLPVLADLNGDGNADYLAVNRGGSVSAWLNNGNDTSAVAGWLPVGTIANVNQNIRWGDIDGDGLADYMSVDLTTGAANAWLNGGRRADGSWIWYPQNQIAAGECNGVKTCYVEFGDIDGDGKADYLVGDYTTGATNAWLSGGLDPATGKWIWYPQPPGLSGGVIPKGALLKWADSSNRHLADFWQIRPDGSVYLSLNIGPSAGPFSLARMNGQGRTLSPTVTSPGSVSFQVADINQDGCADLLKIFSDGSVNAYLACQPGSSPAFLLTGGSQIASGVGAPGSQIEFADINGDGQADYLVVPPTGQITAWLNNGGSYKATY